MTFDELKQHAYHNCPIPADLNETERLQYIAARRIYAGYKSGEIDRTEAEPMLGKVQEYPRLVAADKRALLRYIFAFLCEDAGYGDREALENSKFVARMQRAVKQNGT